jgi:hypothetical protein
MATSKIWYPPVEYLFSPLNDILISWSYSYFQLLSTKLIKSVLNLMI